MLIASVALAWEITLPHFVLPELKVPSRIKENLEDGFKLDSTDLNKIPAIDRRLKFNDMRKDFGYDLFVCLDGKQE